MDTIRTPFFQRKWVRYGIISGIIVSLLGSAYYVISEDVLFSRWAGLVSIIIQLGAGIAATLEKKKRQGGYITYSDAMGTSLGAFMVSVLIYSIFNALLFYVIDPGLVDSAIRHAIDMMRASGPSKNMSQADFEKAIDAYQQNAHKLFVLQVVSPPFVLGVIGVIIYLISSAIIKKEPK